MQQSYRWQPHLPFMPINLPNVKWAERYNFKFLTLPIVKVSGTWGLDIQVADLWYRHVQFFSKIISKWRNHLAYAPMSVDYVPDIRNHNIYQQFDKEHKARRYYWYYRTLIFSLFAEFAFVASFRPKWREEVHSYCHDNHIGLDEKWLNEVENNLCDFWHTKRAGVIIDVATTELWPFLPLYFKNGVPVLMEVGRVMFHDKVGSPLKLPTISITQKSGREYSYIPLDWPSMPELLDDTKNFLKQFYPHRLGPLVPAPPPSFPRPIVEEVGGNIHQRPATTPWVNPYTNEPCNNIQVSPLAPANPQQVCEHIGWIEFLDSRHGVNKHTKPNETLDQKQNREARIRESIIINKPDFFGPSKESEVYRWVEEILPAKEGPIVDGEPQGVSMKDDPGFIWKRVRLTRAEVEKYWDEYFPTQRLYDSFLNQWDLNVLFDANAQDPNLFNDINHNDEDDPMGDNATHINNLQMSFLDQLNVAPERGMYSAIQLLSPQITIISPKDLNNWVFLTFGLRCSTPSPSSISFPLTSFLIGYVVTQQERDSPPFMYLQEFVSYIVKREFKHPRLAVLSDVHQQHPSALDIHNKGIFVNRVKVSTSETGSPYRIGFIITPKNDNSHNHGWILVVFEATSVLQIIRNSWGSSLLEELVRHLVRHGIHFCTLVLATKVVPEAILKLNEAPKDFTTIPPLNRDIPLNSSHYTHYVDLRQAIIKSPHGRAAFRKGGILWRLAMESEEDFQQVINEIMDGPSELGTKRGEYLFIEGLQYYDLVVSSEVGDIICGVHGTETGRHNTIGCTSLPFFLFFC